MYFGGGTPALFARDSLSAILDALRAEGVEAAETSLEANPLDVTPTALREWRRMGIDRLSIGVQSFEDGYLAALGRDHDGAAALRAVEAALASGMRVSIDLIYGGPSHDQRILSSDVARIRELGVPHVSAYQLTVEPQTVFGRRQRKGDLPLPSHDETADLSDWLVLALSELGLGRYEVSSYARAGQESRHNMGYWFGSEYLGLGMGAHSLAIEGGVIRRSNPRSLRSYLAAPARPAELEELSAEDHFRERLFLALRTRRGVELAELAHQFEGIDVSATVSSMLSDAAERGLVSLAPLVAATASGLDFADALAAQVWERPILFT